MTISIDNTTDTLQPSSGALAISGTLGGVSTLTLQGATSGSVLLQPVAIAGSTTITFPATTGTVITSGDVNTVTNSMLSQVATATLRGRTTAGTGNVEDLTGTQATTLLDTFTSALKGLAPASGGGTTNFLRADGTWAAPAAGVSLSANNAFTGANTFTNATGQIFRQAAATDGILIRGGAAGTGSFTTELIPGTLTASNVVTLPTSTGTLISTTGTQTMSGAKSFSNVAGVVVYATSAGTDGIIVKGNAAGTSTFRATIQPATLTASRTFTLPNADGTAALIDTSQTFSGNNTFTGNNQFLAAGGQVFRAAANQDGISLNGRDGGVGNFVVNLFPATLTATRTLTLPDVNGTVVTTGDTGTVTNTMLAGSIDNTKLTNSAITVNGSSTSLGGSVTLYAGTTTLQTSSANQALTGISSVTLPGATSGSVQIIPTAAAGTGTVLTLPATTGTVVTTGDSGTVTGSMIAANTITDGDIATNAAIATSKLASFTAGQVLLGNATGVPTATTLSGDITVNSSGVTALGTGVIVDAEVSATAAIAGTKISPNFGAQLIQSSQPDQALSLTGSLNPSTTSNGLLSVGTLGFSGSRMGGNFTSSQTSYYQVVLQNTSNNAGASCDFVVCNDLSTDTTYYGNFGINSSTYSGTGAFSAPSATYVTATTGPLALGTTTANDIRFSYNSEATDSLTISANDATFGKTIKPRAGTATANTAPLVFTSGTNLTTEVAGAVEYDGTFLYSTPTATSGRGSVPSLQTFRLTGAGGNIGGTIADFFGATSAINLAANSVYDIEFWPYFQKNTAGTVTWTLTASSAPIIISGVYWGSPVSGVAAGTPITGYAGSRAATTAAFGATASITNNAFMAFSIKVQVFTNLATTFKLRVTCGAGTVTPQAGSFYTVRQISGTTGSFA